MCNYVTQNHTCILGHLLRLDLYFPWAGWSSRDHYIVTCLKWGQRDRWLVNRHKANHFIWSRIRKHGFPCQDNRVSTEMHGRLILEDRKRREDGALESMFPWVYLTQNKSVQSSYFWHGIHCSKSFLEYILSMEQLPLYLLHILT